MNKDFERFSEII